MKKTFAIVMTVLFAAGLSGCRGNEVNAPFVESVPVTVYSTANTPPPVLLTTEPAAQLPEPTFESMSNNNFDLENALFEAMPHDENYMVSPVSLRMALMMAANGAGGTTRDEILSALGIEDLDKLNQIVAEFILFSNANELVEFNIANSIWLNEDLFICDDIDFTEFFANIITGYFDGVAYRVGADNGADIVNAWIAEQTRDRITNVVSDGTFDPVNEVLALLVNAIYFKGDWARQFDKAATRDDVFTDRNSDESMLPFMEKTLWFDFVETEYFRMLAKPYMDNNIRMYFILPNTDERPAFSLFLEAIESMQRKNINLRLPRFTTEFQHDNLVEILRGMGIEAAFIPFVANFLDMFTDLPPGFTAFIGNIIQKTFIEVDEEGTEAAAVTVIEMAATDSVCYEPPPLPFHLNSPFIYFIRNDATGDILFIGEFAFAG